MASNNLKGDEDVISIFLRKYKLDGKKIDEIAIKAGNKNCMNPLAKKPVLFKESERIDTKEHQTSIYTEKSIYDENQTALSARNISFIGEESCGNKRNFTGISASRWKHEHCEMSNLNSVLDCKQNFSFVNENKQLFQKESPVILKRNTGASVSEFSSKEDDIDCRLSKNMKSTSPNLTTNISNSASGNSEQSDDSMSKDIVKDLIRSRKGRTVKSNGTNNDASEKMEFSSTDNYRNSRLLYSDCKQNSVLQNRDTTLSKVKCISENLVKCSTDNNNLTTKSIVTDENNTLMLSKIPSSPRTNSGEFIKQNIDVEQFPEGKDFITKKTTSSKNVLHNALLSDRISTKDGFDDLALNQTPRITKKNENVVEPTPNNFLTDEKRNFLKKPLKSDCTVEPLILKKRLVNAAGSWCVKSPVTEKNYPLKDSVVQNIPPISSQCEVAFNEDKIKVNRSLKRNKCVSSSNDCNIEQAKRQLAFESARTSSELNQESEKSALCDTNEEKRVKYLESSLILSVSKSSNLKSNIPQKMETISKASAKASVEKRYVPKKNAPKLSACKANDPNKIDVAQNLSPTVPFSCKAALTKARINVKESLEINGSKTLSNSFNTQQVKRKLLFEVAGTSSEFYQISKKTMTNSTSKYVKQSPNTSTSQERKRSLHKRKAKREYVDETNLRRSERIRLKQFHALQKDIHLLKA